MSSGYWNFFLYMDSGCEWKEILDWPKKYEFLSDVPQVHVRRVRARPHQVWNIRFFSRRAYGDICNLDRAGDYGRTILRDQERRS